MLNQEVKAASSTDRLGDASSIETLFSTAIGLVCGEEFASITDLASALFNQLTGNSDPQPDYTAALNQLSCQMSNLQNYLSNLATSVVYQEECFNITSTITGMQSMIAQPAANLDYEQIVSMCTFLSPGASTLNQPDYQSAINDLLIATYGADVTIQTLQANTAPALGLNTSCQAFAIASDGAGSQGGQGFYDFVQAQVNLSIAVSIIIVSITNTANQVYAILGNTSNQQIWLKEFTDQAFNEILTSTLNGSTMLAEISNPTAGTYLTTVLGPCIMNAPQGICSYLFNIVADMTANVTSPGSTNPSFALIDPNSPNCYLNAVSECPTYPTVNNNVFCFGPLGQTSYLTPSFYNNQPGNQVLLQDYNFGSDATNYLFVTTDQEDPYQMVLYGQMYPNGNFPDNVFEFEWIVYMPSLNNLYNGFNNTNSNFAISADLVDFTSDWTQQATLNISIKSYDCTDPNQQFQLQLYSNNE